MKKGLSADSAGVSLLEVIIAMAVSVVLVSGLVFNVTTAIRNSQFSRHQTLATKFSQEAIEKIRAYRDQNSWTTFTTNCGSLSTMGITVPLSPFTRTVSCVVIDANKNSVTITVSWTDPTGTHQSQLTSYFSNQSLWK